MRIMTCNVRASTMANDKGAASWQARKSVCFRAIEQYNPDFICLQECSAEQFEDFSKQFNDRYDVFWVSPYVDFDAPENAIFYRRNTFKIVTYGGYHLSATPHIAAASCFGDNCRRVANYMVMENSEHQRFRLLNTHISVEPASALPQAKMLLEDSLARPSDIPQILTGDLNSDINSEVMQMLLEHYRDTHAEATGINDERFTYHEFIGENYKNSNNFDFHGKIDWILTLGNIKCSKSEIIMYHEGDVYPSDHYFVVTDLELGKG